uniref:Uncharacterized protein n=1 Tax=Peromyscus maniculatus bairdii TaxID=230844 RepID=A0A8C8W881_PERMB
MLMNCKGVHILQFICSAGQKPLLILAAKQVPEQTPTSNKFMMRKNSSRKVGAKSRRSSRSLLTMAKGTSGGIQYSIKR